MEKRSRRQFLGKMFYLSTSAMFLPVVSRAVFFSASSKSSIMNSSNNPEYLPAYVELQKSGELKARGEVLWDMMRNCQLCPRECGKNRIRGRRGDCNASSLLEISSAYPHFGEEKELVGSNGSGTIFFTNCSLHCVFCINYEISHLGQGKVYSISEMANMMLLLQGSGCHNINFVTPSHYLPHILLALDEAAGRGLRLPVVYNTCGWEKTDILMFLDGVADVYLADFKYDDAISANKYSPGASSYPEITKKALMEMNRQVGVAQTDPSTGLINRGLMIRHLVMPNNAAKSDNVMKWIGSNLPKNTYVNIMSQYTPMYKAGNYPEISRRITPDEFNKAILAAKEAGLTNLRFQSQ